jgi:hypothetical protein
MHAGDESAVPCWGILAGGYVDAALQLCYNVVMKRKEQKDTSINTRYPQDVLEVIRQFAQEDSRSFNGMVIWILREYIKQRQGK